MSNQNLVSHFKTLQVRDLLQRCTYYSDLVFVYILCSNSLVIAGDSHANCISSGFNRLTISLHLRRKPLFLGENFYSCEKTSGPRRKLLGLGENVGPWKLMVYNVENQSLADYLNMNCTINNNVK